MNATNYNGQGQNIYNIICLTFRLTILNHVKMKKAILTSFIFIFTTNLHGQEIRISVAPTINNARYFKPIDGGPGHIPKFGFSTSIGYFINPDRKLTFGVDLSYQLSTVEITAGAVPQNPPPSYSETLSLLSLGLNNVVNFKKEFYLRINPCLDIQIDYSSENSIDNQTGLGLSAGFGKSFKIKETIFINLEPRLWVHNIIAFNDDNYPLRLITTALNIGVGFHYKNDGLIER